MKSLRIAFLAILTLCVFALFDFFTSGFWIFPFPVYKTGLFFLVVAILAAEKKTPAISGFLALGWSFALMLSSRFFLRTFISESEFETFEKGPFISFAMIAFLLLFAVWIVLFSSTLKHKLMRLLAICTALIFCICLTLELYNWAIIPLLVWAAIMFTSKNRQLPEFGILVLIVFIYVSTWIMGFYASTEIAGTKIQATGTDFILFSM